MATATRIKRTFPQRLALGAAVSAALLSGYGSRQAFAGSCTGGAGTYVCTGAADNATDTTVIVNTATPINVTTTSGFGIDTTGMGGDAFRLLNNITGNALTFTDNFGSSITGATYGITAKHYGTGALSITSTGTVTGNTSYGIYARINNTNGTDLTINSAAVSGGSDGIYTVNQGTGALSITSTGTVTGTTRYGIYANNEGTDLTINSAAVSGGDFGIRAKNEGTGVLSITSTGTVTGNTKYGIFAYNSATAKNINITAVDTTGGKSGIFAKNLGTGSTTITSTGTATGTSASGIYAYNTADGIDINITAADTMGGTSGLFATNNGSGSTTIISTGTATGAGQYGIYAINESGKGANVSITANNATGGAYGIQAENNGSGSTTVTSTGTIVGTTFAGIFASATENGDLTISTAGSVSGGRDGIRASNEKGVATGSTFITVSGTVMGGSGAGIRNFSDVGINSLITLNDGASVGTSSGGSGVAILDTGGDTTVTLNTGSSVTGSIELGAGDDTINLAGGDVSGVTLFDGGAHNTGDTANVFSGASVNVSFTNFENINLFGAGVVLGNNVITVDATAESSRSVVLAGLTSSIHHVVSQRLAHKTTLKPVQQAQVGSTGLSSGGMLFQERAPVAWAQVFGGTFDRDSEGGAVGYETDHEGFALGYEWDNNTSRFGLMGGVAHSDTDSDINSFQTDVDSYFVGAYGHYNLGSVNLTASVLGGYSDHDNKRYVMDNINGLEVARSDVSSTFLSPSLTLSSAFSATDKIELRPSATISYSVAWMDDYKEKGTTSSNLTVDDRTLKILTARLQLAAAYKISQASEVELRAGVNSRNSDDESTHASLLGTNFSYSNVGDDSNTGGFVGANIRMATMDNLGFVADVEYGKSSDEDSLTGSLSLNYTF